MISGLARIKHLHPGEFALGFAGIVLRHVRGRAAASRL